MAVDTATNIRVAGDAHGTPVGWSLSVGDSLHFPEEMSPLVITTTEVSAMVS